ncbi:hypothetical protein RhiJN_03828 [Ceratobasidium sp. AG-Ba]|nr:hypothetical protein RhiJN_03828 [Ceratobasidium sp. AG-Ba]
MAILPNLVSICVDHPAATDDHKQVDALLDWLELLLSPLQRLKTVKIGGKRPMSGETHTRYLEFIEQVINDYQDLDSLSISYEDQPVAPMLSSVVSLYYSTVIDISSLELAGVELCSELYFWLARLGKLQRLRLCMLGPRGPLDIHQARLDDSVFSQLCSLELECQRAGRIVAVCQTPIIKHLASLSVKFDERWDNTTDITFFELLAAHCRSLTELCLDTTENSEPELLIRNIPLIQNLPLRKLFLPHCTWSDCQELKGVHYLALLWPSLEMLDLPACNVPFGELGSILPFTPHLFCLRLDIKGSSLRASSFEQSVPYWVLRGTKYSPFQLVSSTETELKSSNDSTAHSVTK